ncbi:MAG TPA: sigma-54 dependent transcriptional regulator, partial [Geothrix sp.]
MSLASTQRILLVEDEPGLREVLTLALEGAGFGCEAVSGIEEGRQALREAAFDGVLSDLKLKDGSGIELLTWMKEEGLETPVVIMTAYATTETTVQALNQGAVDFITKPFKHEELIGTLKGLLAAAEPAAPPPQDLGELVGVGPVMRRINALIGKVSRADTTVLLTGESGTGKEVVARLIHRFSDRAKGPFVAVNCGALPEALLESELFGFEKGAFTGAHRRKYGRFEMAQNGTIFLDEISEMHLDLQSKLLHVLQEKQFFRIGGETEVKVNCRILTATNKNLEQTVDEGRFRRDLFYRINVVNILIPPLRERKEDIPLLADYFLTRYSEMYNREAVKISPKLMEMFLSYAWPGNVRELENNIKRLIILGNEGQLISEFNRKRDNGSYAILPDTDGTGTTIGGMRPETSLGG